VDDEEKNRSRRLVQDGKELLGQRKKAKGHVVSMITTALFGVEGGDFVY